MPDHHCILQMAERIAALEAQNNMILQTLNKHLENEQEMVIRIESLTQKISEQKSFIAGVTFTITAVISLGGLAFDWISK